MVDAVISLLYISRSRLSPADAEAGVEAIVATSQGRNRTLHVTGALIFSGRHFAQLLEGQPAAVETLMESIRRDSRHDQVEVVDVLTGVDRQFPAWSLAYRGSASFVDGLITSLREPSTIEERASDLHRLRVAMRQFVTPI